MTLPIPKAVLEQHTVILGKTRSGKSSTMRLLVERLLDDAKPVCIIDPKGDWWGLKSSANGKEAGYEVVIFGGKHADVPINAHSGKVVAELVATGNRPCIIDLGGWMVGERTRFFIDFASTLFTRTHGHRWLCIDEAHNFAPQGKIMDPDAGKMLHWANRLASEGAGKGIVLISASQRPQKLHKDYLTSHETLIAKRVIHPLDRGAMKDWIDGCGDPTKGKEVLDSLASIQRSEGWVWSPEIGFGPKLITFPMFSTYDSFAVQTGAADRKLKGWASVDLDDVKSKLAAVVEEAKANDPKELRAELATKTQELAALKAQMESAVASKIVADPNAIKKAKEAGFEQARKKLDAAMRREVNQRIKEGLKAVRKHALEAIERIDDELKEIDGKDAELAVAIDPEVPAIPPAPVRPLPVQPAARVAQPRAIPRPETPSDGDKTLSGPERRILNSLATWRDMDHEGPSNAQAAWLASYSPTSTSYTNPRGALKTKELIYYPAPDHIALTDTGAAAAVALVIKGGLLEYVLAQLPGPERRILEGAASHYPNAASNEQVAEGAQYSATSTSYTNPRGALRTKELITLDRGMVRAADWLFANVVARNAA